MTVNGISGVSMQEGQMGVGQANDPYSRQIKQQIADAQKQLQELSSNQDMSPEEKSKKRQELQKEISDLNMQLKQHQIELRKEKQQENGPTMDDMLGGSNKMKSGKAGNESAGISQASMTAMISADTSMKMANVQGSVATGMEGKAGVLEAEIKLDASRGGDVRRKQEELAKVTKKAEEATASQMTSLADANKKMKEAAKSDQTTSDNTDEKKADGRSNSEQLTDKTNGDNPATENADRRNENAAENTSVEETTAQTVAYHPVDIRL